MADCGLASAFGLATAVALVFAGELPTAGADGGALLTDSSDGAGAPEAGSGTFAGAPAASLSTAVSAKAASCGGSTSAAAALHAPVSMTRLREKGLGAVLSGLAIPNSSSSAMHRSCPVVIGFTVPTAPAMRRTPAVIIGAKKSPTICRPLGAGRGESAGKRARAATAISVRNAIRITASSCVTRHFLVTRPRKLRSILICPYPNFSRAGDTRHGTCPSHGSSSRITGRRSSMAMLGF